MVHVEAPDQDISWTSAVGHTSKEAKQNLQKEQPLLIASNTKTYVAAAILKLVEQEAFELDDPIDNLLPIKTKALLQKSGYDTNGITPRQLLSHSSGITDYVDEAYFTFVDQNPKHQWTRDEQIQLAMDKAKPVEPGTAYAYGDINYLLLTEIIESQAQQPFYTAMRKLLGFDQLNLDYTWFVNLEKTPSNALAFPEQYSSKFSKSSSAYDPSWDLFGGGGLAANAKDLACFFQALFEGKVITDKSVLEEIHTYVLPQEEARNYCLGLFNIPSFFGNQVYYHGGFWGTDVVYLPELNASIAIFTLVREKRNLNIAINQRLIKLLKEHQ